MAFFPTSNPPCRLCGSTRTAKAVHVRGPRNAPTSVSITCENVAACKVRVTKSMGLA